MTRNSLALLLITVQCSFPVTASHLHVAARRLGDALRPVDPADPCGTSQSTWYAAVQRDATAERSLAPLGNVTLFQVRGTFNLKQAPPCNPVCKWECDSPKCEEACSPKCKPPKCQTQCGKYVDSSQCQSVCSEPRCTVTCPSHSCTGSQCTGCFTACEQPSCFLNCSAAQSCTTTCENPECDWTCKKPAECPQPQCSMKCSVPQGCPPGAASPADEGGASVQHFQAPVPQMLACSGEPAQRLTREEASQPMDAGVTLHGVRQQPMGVIDEPTSSREACFTNDIRDWRQAWSASKKKFCCEGYGVGCETAQDKVYFSRDGAEVRAGGDNDCDCDDCDRQAGGRRGLRRGVQGGGRRGAGPGCRRKSDGTIKFDCRSADAPLFATHWSEAKVDFCCRTENIACKYDCESDLDCFESAWSPPRQQWCCKHTMKGCPVIKQAIFECFDGVAEFAWSAERREFCCKTYQQGCGIPTMPHMQMSPPAASGGVSPSSPSAAPPALGSAAAAQPCPPGCGAVPPQPAMTEPAMTEPAMTEPAMAQPAMAQPAAAQPCEPGCTMPFGAAGGVAMAAAESVPAGCAESGYIYAPMDMGGAQPKSLEMGSVACQRRCAAVIGCAHFNFWEKDGGCRLSGIGSNPTTELDGAMAGPPTCMPGAPPLTSGGGATTLYGSGQVYSSVAVSSEMHPAGQDCRGLRKRLHILCKDA